MLPLVLFFNSMLCFGIRAACLPGNILYPVVYPVEIFKERYEGWFANFVHYLTKPIYLCTPCMSSVWGFIFVYYLGEHLGFCNTLDIIGIATYILILCGVNFSIAKLLDK